MVFRLSSWAGTGATASTQDITNISLVDENGTVVAGPVDARLCRHSHLCRHDNLSRLARRHTPKGKVGTDFANNQTIAASTTLQPIDERYRSNNRQFHHPSPTSAITANTMTIKSAVTTISVSATPASQTVVAGAQGLRFRQCSIWTLRLQARTIKFSTIPLTFDQRRNSSLYHRLHAV